MLRGALKSISETGLYGMSHIGSFNFLTVHPIQKSMYVVKTYPLDFLFYLDPTDLPMEEHISTRDHLDFQEIQSNLQDILSTPLDFYFHTSLDTLITPRIFCLIFKAPFRFSLPYPCFTHFYAPRISSSLPGDFVPVDHRGAR